MTAGGTAVFVDFIFCATFRSLFTSAFTHLLALVTKNNLVNLRLGFIFASGNISTIKKLSSTLKCDANRLQASICDSFGVRDLLIVQMPKHTVHLCKTPAALTKCKKLTPWE